MSQLVHYWTLVAGGVATIMLLIRISFTLGRISAAFTSHLDDSAKINTDIEARMRAAERARQRR
jgi:hypothetical protein